MKHQTLLITFILTVFLTAGCSNQTILSGEMDAVSCRTTSFSNGSFQDIVVILNQSNVPDYQKCAEEIIQHVMDNDFHTILFSFDENGYPIGLSATVYLTESDFEKGNHLFQMEYVQDSAYGYRYDIYSNPEMFTLKITK